MKSHLIEFMAAMGWIDMGPQKNQYMISFTHSENDVRINVYFTTMTVTVQSPGMTCVTHKNVGLEKLEKILYGI